MFDVFEGEGGTWNPIFAVDAPEARGEGGRIRKWPVGRLAGEKMHYLSARFSFSRRNLWFSLGYESIVRNCFILIVKSIDIARFSC